MSDGQSLAHSGLIYGYAKGKRRGARGTSISRQIIPFLLEAGYVDYYRTLHPTTLGSTSHMNHLAFRVDYSFISPSFANRLAACDVVTGTEAERVSDHFPS